jgi:UDP-N-acetyl-D-mannosaminuronic acid dehydrogenase
VSNRDHETDHHVTIIGGLGQVGLPFGLTFANEGFRVCLYDLNGRSAEIVSSGSMPFIEYGAEPILRESLDKGSLIISTDISDTSRSRYVAIAIGPPADEYLTQKTRQFLDEFRKIADYRTEKHASEKSCTIGFDGECLMSL